MEHKIDIQIAQAKAENKFRIAEDTFVAENQNRLKWELIKSIALMAISIGFYFASSFHKDWTLFGHIGICFSIWFFYSYFSLRFDLKEEHEKYKIEFQKFDDQYGAMDVIRYEYDERRIICASKNMEFSWDDVKSYEINKYGIFLFFEKGEARIIKDLVSGEEYEHFDRMLKSQINKLKIPLYQPPEITANAKTKVMDIFRYVFAPPIPYLTLTVFLICVIIWGGLLSEDNLDDWDITNRWGYFSYKDILNGKMIGLITTNLVHIDFIHLFFNMYWLIILGSKLEKEEGSLKVLILFLSSAIINSSFEIIFADSTGIGLSGVIYGYLGFYMVARNYSPKYRHYFTSNTIRWFIFWLFLCIVLNYAGVMNIGNAAHFSGFIWGLGAGFLYFNAPHRMAVAGVMIAMMIAAVLPLKWAPWSVVWLSEQAYKAHNEGRYNEARSYYDDILSIDPHDEWAKKNKNLLPAE